MNVIPKHAKFPLAAFEETEDKAVQGIIFNLKRDELLKIWIIY